MNVVVGVGLHSDHQYVAQQVVSLRISRQIARFVFSGVFFGVGALALAGCGNTYRPVVSSVNPVGPAAQPQKYAVAIASTGATTPGLVNIIDFSGDTNLVTVSLGTNPLYLQLDSGGDTAYTLNGDGTTNTFGITTSLIQSQVLQTTLPAGGSPVAILAQGANLYIAEPGLNSVAQLTQTSPPAYKQNLTTGVGTLYTVGIAAAPRVYALSQPTGGGAGVASAIETVTNTISNSIAVGNSPVYGVMTADARRAFILNKGSGTLSVINSQTNALDRFTSPTTNTVTSTIPVGTAPIWADFAPTLTELVVANQGNGTTNGSVTLVSIPLCSQTTVTSNPNCDVNNPVDAVGFGQVVANITVGVNPVMVAVLQDGSEAFVANAGNAAAGIAGSISVINLTTNTVVATIPAGTSTNELDTIVHGHPTYIAATTGTPTGKVYVVSSDSSDISIIRTDTNTVQTHLTLQGTGVSVRVSQP
jgi:DNA-binding beta-propeller fold protein YncE